MLPADVLGDDRTSGAPGVSNLCVSMRKVQ